MESVVREQTHVSHLYGLQLVVVTVAWVAGIVLDSLIHLPLLASLLGTASAFVFIVLLRHDSLGRLVMALILCLLLGMWRYEMGSPQSDPQAINNFISPYVVNVRGIVVDEPKVEGRSRALLVAVSDVSRNAGVTWYPTHGQLEMRLLGTLVEDPYGPNYGDSVQLQGKLQPPSPYSPINVFASIAFPRVTVGEAATGTRIIAALYHFRIVLSTIIDRALPQPEAALLTALVLSLRTPALKPLIPAFNATGVAHLIAPSGFKVTLLAGIVTNIARRLYSRRQQAGKRLLPAQRQGGWQQWLVTAVTVLVILFYTMLSGVVPAAIRAGIMGILLIVAPRLGRVYNVYTGLALSVILMSAVDPLVLWDVGFLLSTLGTLGIVLLTPFFQRLLSPLARLPLGYYAVEIIAVTLAAQVATLPIFTLTFNQISFIAPLTNILTVPLLEAFIVLGVCICVAGLLYAPLASLCGWVVEPLLWYVKSIVTWCFTLPGAYITTNHIPSAVAWSYYALLALTVYLVSRIWPQRAKKHLLVSTQLLPKYAWHSIQLGIVLLFLIATGVSALTLQSNGQLSITFLAVGPTGQPAQGEAILIRTPDGKTLLIDGGSDAVFLSQALDSRLPSWQRSLDAVVLTSTRTDHLAGLQDVVTRYEIGEVIDGGMLHPSSAYALWRSRIRERHFHYIRATQGMNISIGVQVVLQVLWPHASLSKGADEERTNALILRLVAPGARVLFLGEVANSQSALQGFLSEVDSNHLHAEIVQIIGGVTTGFPTELSEVLRAVHPALLIVTPPSERHKAGVLAGDTSTTLFDQASWQTIRTVQAGTTTLSSSAYGWSVDSS